MRESGAAEDKRPRDRRQIPRERTARQAYYAVLEGSAALTRGEVTDISPNGLQIRSDAPPPIGAVVDLEIREHPGEKRNAPRFARGRVVWTATSLKGDGYFGVRFLDHWPDSAPAAFHAVAMETEASGPEIEEVLSTALAGAPQSRRRVSAVALPLALLCLLLLLLSQVPRCRAHQGRFIVRFHSTGQTSQTSGPGEAAEAPAISPTLPEERAAPAARMLAAAFSMTSPRQIAAAAMLFESVLAAGDASPADRFAARIGLAEQHAVQGQRAAAAALLDEALAAQDAVPEDWRAAAQEWRNTLADESQEIPPFFGEMLEYGAAPAPPQTSAPEEDARPSPPPPESVRIEVNRGEHRMTVFQETQVLGTFAVGLGYAGSTPDGDFVIVNKIQHPDWHNRGRRVPAGDPENPLGEFWMGLGNARGPLPYGIHPTDDAASIGGDASRGCIRMRPEDARQVFAWCVPGTPVRILP